MFLDSYIALRSEPGRLLISGGEAQLRIEQPAAELQIRSQPGQLRISSGGGQLQVDSTRPRAEAGYLTWFAFVEDAFTTGEREAQRSVSRRVAFGRAYADVHANPRAIVTAGSGGRGPREWNIALMPRSRPAIRYTPQAAQVDFQPRPPQVQIRARPPIIQAEVDPLSMRYEPRSLTIEVRQRGAGPGGLLDLLA